MILFILKLIRQSLFLDQNGEMLFQAMDQQESWISCGKLWNLEGGNLVRVLSEIWSSFVPSIFLKLPTWATLQLGKEKSSQQSRCKSHSTTLFDFVSLRLQGLIQHQLKPCYANKNPTEDYFHWTQVWSNWSLSRTNWLTVLLKLEERLNEFKGCVTWGVFVWLERMLPNCRRS